MRARLNWSADSHPTTGDVPTLDTLVDRPNSNSRR
jgi:hypothetical protein